MLYHGTISRWHDDKGFGFITQDHTGEELFFDLSDCPPDGERPQVGFVVYFRRQQGANGKVSARQVQGKVFTEPPAVSQPLDYVLVPVVPRRQNSRVRGIVLLLLLTAGIAGYASLAGRSSATAASTAIGTTRPAAAPAAATSDFRCDGRQHCSQMNSLQEAAHFLQHCPDTRMDGDGDGQPCEAQFAN